MPPAPACCIFTGSQGLARACIPPHSTSPPHILLHYTPHCCCPPWTLLPQRQQRGTSPPPELVLQRGSLLGTGRGGRRWPCSRAVTGDPGILLTARAWLRTSSPWALRDFINLYRRLSLASAINPLMPRGCLTLPPRLFVSRVSPTWTKHMDQPPPLQSLSLSAEPPGCQLTARLAAARGLLQPAQPQGDVPLGQQLLSVRQGAGVTPKAGMGPGPPSAARLRLCRAGQLFPSLGFCQMSLNLLFLSLQLLASPGLSPCSTDPPTHWKALTLHIWGPVFVIVY